MFKATARDDQIQSFIDRALGSEDETFKRRLLSVLSRLNENEWLVLEHRLREIVGEADAEKEAAPPQESGQPEPEKPEKVVQLPRAKRRRGMVELPVYDEPSAAGIGNYLDAPEYHIEQYPEDIIPSGADFGVRIQGDSMEPRIHDGGTVFVQSIPAIDPGQIGIFVMDGKTYCKQLAVDHDGRQVRLVSLNKRYADILVGEFASIRTLGRVLGQWTPGRRNDDIFGW